MPFATITLVRPMPQPQRLPQRNWSWRGRLARVRRATVLCSMACCALLWAEIGRAQSNGPVVIVEQCNTYESLGGDTEFTTAELRNGMVGLVSYVTDTDQFCVRTGTRMQRVFVRPTNIHTGIPEPASNALLVGPDECGIIELSDGEWGSTGTNQPLLAYTGSSGVRIVQFKQKRFGGLTFTNQTLTGSDDWVISGMPLSRGFDEVQLRTMNVLDWRSGLYEVVWSRINLEPDATIASVDPIHVFPAGNTDIRSQLHPTDPDRIIRVSLDVDKPGIYEYSATAAADVAMVFDQAPEGLVIRAWTMPPEECAELGLDQSPLGCPAVVLSVPNGGDQGSTLLWKARRPDGTWKEVVRVPYSERVRVVATAMPNLNPPRSAVVATGEGEARIYLSNGSGYSIVPGTTVRTQASEAVYYSESRLLGVYVETAGTRTPMVCMVTVE